MNTFNKLYEELLEAMDRRQFLKMMGKGASVAGVAPGAVGKMTMNLATGSAPININKTIIDFLNLTYDGKTFIDLGPSKSLDLIRNSLSTLYSFIIKNKLPINDRFTVKEVKHALKELDPANIKKVMDEDNMTIDDFFQNFSEQGRDIDGFDGMLRVLFQHNLINKEAQEVIAHHTGSHWYDYVDTPEAKKIRDEIEAGHRRNFHQYQQQQTAKDINYSRMDTAGGSEDVGYSKYDESIKHILEAMDRRQFLKMMGKGAQAAAGASIAPKGAAGGIVGSLIKTTAGSPITQAVKTIFDPKSVNLFIDDKIALNYVSAMKNAILALTPVVGSKSAQISVKTLDEILSGKLYGSDLGDFIEDTELGNLIHFSIITNLYKQNLITPELEKWMFLESNLDPYHLMRLKLYSINLTEPKAVDVKAALNKNYPDWRELSDKKMFGSLDPETEKRLKSSNNRAVERWDKKSAEELKRWEEQDYKDHLGAIRSRMDYAGGSEDVDYAQTFEKFFIENYADGKKPGRKGLAKRSGVNCKQSVSKLRKVAKNSSGERRRMAHWCANMKAGKKKKK